MKTDFAIAKEKLEQVDKYIGYFKRQLKSIILDTKVSNLNKKFYKQLIEDLETQKWNLQLEIESLRSRVQK